MFKLLLWAVVLPFIVLLAFLTTVATLPRVASGTELNGSVIINGHPAGDYGVVYLEPEDKEKAVHKPEIATIIQKNLAFDPVFLVVTAGSTIRFENLDNEIHNAKSYSRPNNFDIGAHFPNTIKEVVLAKPGMVALRCKVHHQMRGVILVVATSWYSPTDPEGNYHLEGFPPGNYRLKTWFPGMEKSEVEESSVKLSIGDSDPKTVKLDVKTRHAIGPLLVSRKSAGWWRLVNEIDAEFHKALASWKVGNTEKAKATVMTTYYQKFGRTGLRSLISQELGERRGRQLEALFLEIGNQLGKSKISTDTTQRIASQIARLKQQLSIDLSRFYMTP